MKFNVIFFMLFYMHLTGVAQAANTVEFLGEITDSTCDVVLEGDSPTRVLLPTVSKTTLPRLDSTAGRTMFALLASGCEMANGKTQFSGYSSDGEDINNVDAASGYLNNVADLFPAENVKLRLIDIQGNCIIKVGYDQTCVQSVFPDGAGNARIPYAVEYISTSSAGASAGAVRGVVVYDLMYQ